MLVSLITHEPRQWLHSHSPDVVVVVITKTKLNKSNCYSRIVKDIFKATDSSTAVRIHHSIQKKGPSQITGLKVLEVSLAYQECLVRDKACSIQRENILLLTDTSGTSTAQNCNPGIVCSPRGGVSSGDSRGRLQWETWKCSMF